MRKERDERRATSWSSRNGSWADSYAHRAVPHLRHPPRAKYREQGIMEMGQYQRQTRPYGQQTQPQTGPFDNLVSCQVIFRLRWGQESGPLTPGHEDDDPAPSACCHPLPSIPPKSLAHGPLRLSAACSVSRICRHYLQSMASLPSGPAIQRARRAAASCGTASCCILCAG